MFVAARTWDLIPGSTGAGCLQQRTGLIPVEYGRVGPGRTPDRFKRQRPELTATRMVFAEGRSVPIGRRGHVKEKKRQAKETEGWSGRQSQAQSTCEWPGSSSQLGPRASSLLAFPCGLVVCRTWRS